MLLVDCLVRSMPPLYTSLVPTLKHVIFALLTLNCMFENFDFDLTLSENITSAATDIGGIAQFSDSE